MKQPRVYSRNQVIDAAFALLRDKGWSAVTTRAIARQMGASTMPIYSHVSSVDDLEAELRTRARSLLQESQLTRYTEHALLNLAFGYVAFARDEKQLFRFLYLDRPTTLELGGTASVAETLLSQFGAESEVGKALAEIGAAGQESLIRYTWVFTHGLAMMVNAGALESSTDDIILQYLQDSGAAFYAWEETRRSRQ